VAGPEASRFAFHDATARGESAKAALTAVELGNRVFHAAGIKSGQWLSTKTSSGIRRLQSRKIRQPLFAECG